MDVHFNLIHSNVFFQEHLLRLEILGALVGRIPPNPLWAELLVVTGNDGGSTRVGGLPRGHTTAF